MVFFEVVFIEFRGWRLVRVGGQFFDSLYIFFFKSVGWGFWIGFC